MAKITLRSVRHSYRPPPRAPADWALERLDIEWADGGAYALLGPSGCGKTTLLNIISGLVQPSEGRVLFDDVDVTDSPTERRHIAQVFQFPVVYDTMSVRDNLAFPLINRGMSRQEVDARVLSIARMLDLEGMLSRRASGLSADGKQKVSLGRGLVRSDVNVIMFDEPLTVIDPHLKLALRSKLKELHQRTGRTMIYVTHDQTEALTFAQRVVVMYRGAVVQIGTPIELFDRPRHTFVGHFIGSPGMNVLDCQFEAGRVSIAGVQLPFEVPASAPVEGKRFEIGVRPEFVSLADSGIPVRIVRVSDAGRHQIVEARLGDSRIHLIAGEGAAVPGPDHAAHVRFDESRTRLYADGWLVQ